jgi:NTE family protein
MPFFLDKDGPLRDEIALCLSGGGYRAMLFHAGAIWRLNELGLLRKIALVSSVSGGSIAAGALAVALARTDLQWTGERLTNLDQVFIQPIIKQAGDGIDYEAIALGLLPWDHAFRHVAESYGRNFAGTRTLQDLPEKPEFVFNTTSLMSGRDMQFSRSLVLDWRVGSIQNPKFPLSEVIAASSAFPPFLSPVTFDFTHSIVDPPERDGGLHRPPFTQRCVLSDGGVYDNMGLEPAWKRFKTLLVSNAGRPFGDLEAPPTDWLNQLRRVVDITMDQDQALRERILIYTYSEQIRTGALWGLDVHAGGTGTLPPLLSQAEYDKARDTRTRLNTFTRDEQALLMKAGYAFAEESIRLYYAPLAGRSTAPGTTPPTP